jgi:hypothetical protein
MTSTYRRTVSTHRTTRQNARDDRRAGTLPAFRRVDLTGPYVPIGRAWVRSTGALLCARVRCVGVWRRSAFLKEWGCVKVLVLVASLGVVNAGAGGSRGAGWLGCRVPHHGSSI